MDIVYPLGSSRWKNNEIKFSIRSLFKHSSEQFDKIFIIGEKPKFFEYSDRLIHIPFVETQAKEVNIWEKVLKAATDERVSDEFFFNNDDYFFLNDFSLSTFPHYHKGNLRSLPNIIRAGTSDSYHKKARRTMEVLESHNMSTWHFDIHTPNRIEKAKFIEAYEFFKPELYKQKGLIISTCYANYHKLEPTFKDDCKLHKIDLKWLKQNHQNQLLFSIYDDAASDDLLRFLTKLYPDKSPVEL